MDLQALNRQWEQFLGGIVRLRSWLDLCRLPHSLTTAADPLAGALLVGAGFSDIPFAVALMLAAFFLHAGAVALNDWHDFKTDRIENPGRPIAAGRVGRWYGLLVAIGLLGVGWTFASVPGFQSGQIGLVILAAILLYEFIMKAAPAGKAIPGIARALSLLMGMMLVPVAASNVGWPLRIFCMCVLAVYTLGDVVLAQRPPDDLRRAIAVSGSIILGVAIFALATMRFFFPTQAVHPIAASWIAVLLVLVGYPLVLAIWKPSGETLRAAARAAMLGSILVGAAAVAFVRNLHVSLPVAALVLLVLYIRHAMDRAAPLDFPSPSVDADADDDAETPEIPSRTLQE